MGKQLVVPEKQGDRGWLATRLIFNSDLSACTGVESEEGERLILVQNFFEELRQVVPD